MTQMANALRLRGSRDTARVRVIEALIAHREPALADAKAVAMAFLERGDYLDAGILIRSIERAAETSSPASFARLAAALSRSGHASDHALPVSALRLKTLRKWVRAVLDNRHDDVSRILVALLDADELLTRRALRNDPAVHKAWAEWAMNAALATENRCPLLCENPAEVAAPAALRFGKALEIAHRQVAFSASSPRRAARLARQLVASFPPAGHTP